MEIKIKIKTEMAIGTEFLGDILVTAFDGQYGGCWDWAEPVPGIPWPMKDDLGNWKAVQVRVRRDEPTGNAVFDREDGFEIDWTAIAGGLERIINRDYLNAGESETAEGLRQNIMQAVYDEDAGMIDAYDAAAIVQAAAFGKVIFG